MARTIAATIAGILVAVITVGLVEGAGHAIWPPPAGTNVKDPTQLAAIMDKVPLPAKIAVMVAWFLGAVAGCFAALRIDANRWPPRIVAALMVAGAVWSMAMIPHPTWMVAGGLLLPIVGWWVALRLDARKGAKTVLRA